MYQALLADTEQCDFYKWLPALVEGVSPTTQAKSVITAIDCTDASNTKHNSAHYTLSSELKVTTQYTIDVALALLEGVSLTTLGKSMIMTVKLLNLVIKSCLSFAD